MNVVSQIPRYTEFNRYSGECTACTQLKEKNIPKKPSI